MFEGNEEHEDMDTTPAPDEDRSEAFVTLLVKWSEGAQPPKARIELERVLQTRANKGSFGGNCSVVKFEKDGSAVIKIEPAPAVKDLQDLTGQELNRKDGGSVTILSISLTPQSPKTEVPQDVSLNPTPSFTLEHEQNQQVEQNPFSSSAAASASPKDTCSCSVPVSHFLYVYHIYKEEVQRIQKENGVQMAANVLVKFEGDQKGADPKKALLEFTNLVQKCLGESDGSAVPYKRANAEGLKETLKIVQRKESKLLLTVSSDEATICGPRPSQDAVLKALDATSPSNASASFGEARWAPDTSVKVDMNNRDPLVDTGVPMEESSWQQMNIYFTDQMSKIKAKFGVDFNESSSGQGKVKVKVCYHRFGGNVLMESHAIRALLRLYQKIATLSRNFLTSQQGAAGFNGSTENGDSTSQSGGGAGGDGAAVGTKAGDEEDRCPICMDAFTNKTRLKCKHEFCEECLQQSEKALGPTCPVCKDVFGMMEGNQPDGKMTWRSDHISLPGFDDCGTITITYHIYDGRQTEKHPHPGKSIYGIMRTAYLPDNKEGNEVLHLLKKAFDQKLIFTVGTSRTTGMEDQVTWNDIHHKTSRTGGSISFGYPDDTYLCRVKEELKAKGIV